MKPKFSPIDILIGRYKDYKRKWFVKATMAVTSDAMDNTMPFHESDGFYYQLGDLETY